MNQVKKESIRILLVEDNEHDVTAFRRALRADFALDRITVCVRAEEALAKTKTTPFDLMVTDHKLPGMSGLELCQTLLAQAEQRFPLVLLTGYGSEHLAVEALKAGVDDYLIKDPGRGYLDLLPVMLPQVVERFETRLARRQAEQALRESEARYRLLAENSLDLIVLLDQSGEIIYASPSVSQALGYPSEAIDHQNISAIIADQDASGLLSLLETLPKTGEGKKIELVLQSREGHKIIIEALFSRVVDEQEGRQVLLAGRDITERKQAEKTLRQYATELKRRNEELDAFAHTVAHDLKHYLTMIIGLAEVLRDYGDELSTAELQEQLETIGEHGRKVSSIIDALLLLAAARQKQVNRSSLDMAQIIAEVRKRLQSLIEIYEPQLILPEQWPAALGYAPWIEEVWLNYISNAIKYGGRPPKVELGATPRPGGKILFWVQDNGDGLTPDQQAQLFTPFTRFEPGAEGHGLGLSIVRRIVEKLGGEVGVESAGQPGQGSRFFFTLPAAEETEQPDHDV